jgi:hypothetical protein
MFNIYGLILYAFLQDDPQDWQKECSLLQDVSSKSLLTLAAIGASDSNGGCLFQRNIGRTRRLQLGIERRSISPRKFYRIIRDKSFTVFVRSHPNESHSHLLKGDIGSQRPRPLEHQSSSNEKGLGSSRTIVSAQGSAFPSRGDIEGE